MGEYNKIVNCKGGLFMEQKMDELIKSINNLSGFSWSDLISLIALIGSWITIFLLLKEKYHKVLSVPISTSWKEIWTWM